MELTRVGFLFEQSSCEKSSPELAVEALNTTTDIFAASDVFTELHGRFWQEFNESCNF